MNISHALIETIESTHVAFQGLSHRLRFIGADEDGQDGATLTVETVHEGVPHRAACAIPLPELENGPAVAEALAAAMHAVLTSHARPADPTDH